MSKSSTIRGPSYQQLNRIFDVRPETGILNASLNKQGQFDAESEMLDEAAEQIVRNEAKKLPRNAYTYCLHDYNAMKKAAKKIPKDDNFIRRLLWVPITRGLIYFGKGSRSRLFDHISIAVKALQLGQAVDSTLDKSLVAKLAEMIQKEQTIGFAILTDGILHEKA